MVGGERRGGEGRSTWAPPPSPRDKLWIRPWSNVVIQLVLKTLRGHRQTEQWTDTIVAIRTVSIINKLIN